MDCYYSLVKEDKQSPLTGRCCRTENLLTPLLQNMKMGAMIDEREARRGEVVIEFPTKQDTIHLINCTHNLTLSQAYTSMGKTLNYRIMGKI